MRKEAALLIILAIVLVSCGAIDEKGPIAGMSTAPFQTTLADARAVALADGKNILLDFYTDW